MLSQVLDPDWSGDPTDSLTTPKPIYSDELAAQQVMDWDHHTTAILDARKWGPSALGTAATVTYGYERDPARTNGDFVLVTEAPAPLLPLIASERRAVESYIPLIEDIANIDFVRIGATVIDDGADLMVRKRDAGFGNAPPPEKTTAAKQRPCSPLP